VKDHFISYNKNKKIGKDMFGALVELFQNSYVSHQTLLRNQLTSSYDEDKTIMRYLTQIIELRDQMDTIGT